eukprot:jgi/Bigna1/125564/aug1.1_g272
MTPHADRGTVGSSASSVHKHGSCVALFHTAVQTRWKEQDVERRTSSLSDSDEGRWFGLPWSAAPLGALPRALLKAPASTVITATNVQHQEQEERKKKRKEERKKKKGTVMIDNVCKVLKET